MVMDIKKNRRLILAAGTMAALIANISFAERTQTPFSSGYSREASDQQMLRSAITPHMQDSLVDVMSPSSVIAPPLRGDAKWRLWAWPVQRLSRQQRALALALFRLQLLNQWGATLQPDLQRSEIGSRIVASIPAPGRLGQLA